ncbi:flagellar hook capping FlgD N-terminal domain-containing protein [Marinobacterium jannaschii]|uniref:flagellar hook capping FlgD N-terminal domain-containing protein n=1 Tax=Marinobacterium jannaschii TaxID=64970 RepID=UPI00048256E4|nr:flagellar hook capping FlgD N-terminal domain-containing protein [Marinobacterium jannaschii]
MSGIDGVNSNVFEQINQTNKSKSTASTEKSQAQQDSDMFMKLLVAQLGNQDPTSPADTGQFMEQISSMSMVEGINNLQSSIGSLTSSMMTSQAALQASSMVGRSVFVPQDTAPVGIDGNDSFARGSFNLKESASDVRIKVFDEDGELVDSVQLGAKPPGEDEFYWGLSADPENGVSEPGEYRFLVETQSNDGVWEAVDDVQLAFRVNSVTLGENGIGMSVNTSAGTFDSSKIRQIGV